MTSPDMTPEVERALEWAKRIANPEQNWPLPSQEVARAFIQMADQVAKLEDALMASRNALTAERLRADLLQRQLATRARRIEMLGAALRAIRRLVDGADISDHLVGCITAIIDDSAREALETPTPGTGGK